jgi:hypothetical protein
MFSTSNFWQKKFYNENSNGVHYKFKFHYSKQNFCDFTNLIIIN